MSPARLALPLMLCGLLAACATPREQCISRATSELRTTQAALAEARDNVARGYAVFRERVPYTVYDTCYRRHHAHGGLLPYPCLRHPPNIRRVLDFQGNGPACPGGCTECQAPG